MWNADRGLRSGAWTLLLTAAGVLPAVAGEFEASWPSAAARTWVGPEYYANRLQDWRIRDGALECVEAGEDRPMRTVHLLVAALDESPAPFEMSVTLGPIEDGGLSDLEAWGGFLVGVGGGRVDYRLSALTHHKPGADGGILVAVDGTGRLTFRDNTRGPEGVVRGPLRDGDLPELPAECSPRAAPPAGELADLRLELVGAPHGDGYELFATLQSGATRVASARLPGLDPARLAGNVALVSHRSPRGGAEGYRFRAWRLAGEKVAAHPERAFGPVLSTLHTVSDGVLKLTAQMGPLGEQDTQTARLEVRGPDGAWRTVGTSALSIPSYTFTFRVTDWDVTRDTPYRVAYESVLGPGTTRTCHYEGTIRKEPSGPEIVIAAIGCHRIHVGTPIQWNSNAIWFPHTEVVAALRHHQPDLLFFSGDQVYEGDLTGPVYRPLDKALLDYLDKWYRWCWAFRELTRDIPSICIPDDHDVYHGNLWGDGGRAATRDLCKGGYYMPPEFVNMVQCTQTSHLPDPADSTPVDQGIGVYYTSLNHAGVSYAILEDRKWKSSPAILPPEADVRTGWIANPGFEARAHADAVSARLLGERQLAFLRDWAADWHGGIWMKVVLSQTTFVNLATIPKDDTDDGAAVGLPPVPSGEVAPGEKLARDTDSNGWPAPARDRALREFRRALALHISGDQHLASVVHYGINDWEDAGYSFCLPTIGNIWPRRWHPPSPGENHVSGTPAYTGRFRDGFGNRMTVLAVANPLVSGHEPADLHDRATGYGIVRLNRDTREITLECWPRWVDPSAPDVRQYLGWPIRLRQIENGLAHPGAYLPELQIEGEHGAIVQVVDEASGEVVYTLRAKGPTFHPPVRKPGPYTVKVGEPGTPAFRVLEHLSATPAGPASAKGTPSPPAR